jgi:hypothetical protein
VSVPLMMFRPDVPYASQAEERCLMRFQFEDVPAAGAPAEDAPVFQGSIHSNWNPNTDSTLGFDEPTFQTEMVLALRMVLAKQNKRLIRADVINRVSFELGSAEL